MLNIFGIKNGLFIKNIMAIYLSLKATKITNNKLELNIIETYMKICSYFHIYPLYYLNFIIIYKKF